MPIRIRHKVLFGELIVSYDATIAGPTTPALRDQAFISHGNQRFQ